MDLNKDNMELTTIRIFGFRAGDWFGDVTEGGLSSSDRSTSFLFLDDTVVSPLQDDDEYLAFIDGRIKWPVDKIWKSD